MGLIRRLQTALSKSPRLAIGLISGTSVDGVDAALIEIANHGIETRIRPLHFITFPYPHDIQKSILKCSVPGQGSVDEICRLNVLVAEVFSQAALSLLREANVPIHDVAFIGSHGQTIHHLPEPMAFGDGEIRSTLQIGDPSWIAKRTGIVTVGDFRPADMALGGEGAPLVPYFDYITFRHGIKNRAVLNLGGIANFTILKAGAQIDDVMAFDTGPANMLIDGLMSELYNRPFDDEGAVARSGIVSKSLLDFCLEHSYFRKKPPKSTGREDFGETYLQEVLAAASAEDLCHEDIVATATELTTFSIWESYRNFVENTVNVDEIIVSGGGLYNKYLVESLTKKFKGASVLPIDQFDIPGEAKEAICFAVLANETMAGNPGNVPSATGASGPTILGKICL